MDRKKQQTACFTGHRLITEELGVVKIKLAKTIERLIESGYLYFGAGGARGFDALASEMILKYKLQYPKIHLILVLPFDKQYKHEQNWKPEEIWQYHQLKATASKVVILSSGYYPGIYYRRNRYLVDNSSACISYMLHTNSGTGYTFSYAATKGLQTFNIATIL